MKVLIVHNLLSGYGDGAIYDFIRTYLEDGDEVSIRAFGGNSTFEELLHDAPNFDFVIACGGDGTISAICYALRNTDIPILPFPAGTANLLALNIFSPNEPHALCKLVDEGLTLNFDIGEIETADKTFGFTLMAGCGYDQTIMHGAKKHKHLLGDMAYFEAAFTNPKPQVSHFTITIDGTTVECDGIGVVVANFSKIQFDLMVSDKNLPRDGMLDVVILKTKNAFELLPVFMAKVVDHSGALANKMNGLELYRGKEIHIDADPAMLVQFDGEPTEISTPLTLRCLPQATRFIVSEECIKEFDPEPEQ